jgi:hypothetical protein
VWTPKCIFRTTHIAQELKLFDGGQCGLQTGCAVMEMNNQIGWVVIQEEAREDDTKA